MLAAWGGPSTCTCDLLDGLHDMKAQVDLLSSSGAVPDELILGKDKPWMKLLPFDWKTPLALSDNFRHYLEQNPYDVYHINTIWLYPSHITCKIARGNNRPYVLSPHGMLYPTALKVSAWKKWFIKRLWVDNDIHKATCIHATCEQEMKHIRQYGYHGAIAVIPNPVVFPKNVSLRISIPSEKKIGYLGRLHPIKKVENLLEAVAKVVKSGKKDFRLEIMGKGAPEYESFLLQETARLGIRDFVDFIGFVSGKEKYKRLSGLRALFVPSDQENFGMIVPEALICGTPVYASLGTPWSELNDLQCGWWKDNNPETIAEVIKEVLDTSDSDLLAMGQRGRTMIENKYEQHKVAQMMMDLYDWVARKKNKPDFVYEE